MKKTNAQRILDQAKVAYTPVAYTYDPDNLDVAHLARENGLPLPLVYKTLVCLTDAGEVVAAVTPGDRQLNLKALAQAVGCKKVELAPLADLLRLTGYQRGGCSPVGMKKNYLVVVDSRARAEPLVYVNAGARGLLLGLAPTDLAKVCRLSWADIS